jgi:hypothetical protein
LVNKKVKKLGWFEKMMLCMNVKIHKENYSQYRSTRKVYKQNKEILRNQRHFVNDACRRAGEDEVPYPTATHSESTIPYNEYNTNRVQWSDFNNVSSKFVNKGEECMEEREEEIEEE